MRKPRKRASAGTVVMLFGMAAVVLFTLAVFVFIRGSRKNLAMDAERLVSSIGGMIAARSPDPARLQAQATVVVVTPALTADVDKAGQTAYTPTPAPSAAQAFAAPAATDAFIAPQSAAPQPAAAQEKARQLTLTFGGSIAYESGVVDACVKENTGEEAYAAVLSGISDDIHADLNIAFLPTLLSADSGAWSDDVAPAQSLAAIFRAGFDYLLLGSQNSLTRGAEGVEDTLALLSGSGISATGLYRRDSASQRAMVQVNGVRVAILSYQEELSKASRQAVTDEAARARLIAVFSREKALSDIKAARAEGADVVLVALRWGAKGAASPTKAQRETAQALCDAGADLLIGTGSEALQPVELLTSLQGDGRQMLVAWSLGTLLSEARDTREVVSGALLHVQLTCGANGAVTFSAVQYTPTYIWRQETEKKQFMFRVLDSAMAAPEGMIQHQREVMGRALALVQSVMKKGVAVQR